jgi:hypothetical protein
MDDCSAKIVKTWMSTAIALPVIVKMAAVRRPAKTRA